jgi:hypothetical protein
MISFYNLLAYDFISAVSHALFWLLGNSKMCSRQANTQSILSAAAEVTHPELAEVRTAMLQDIVCCKVLLLTVVCQAVKSPRKLT